MKDLELMGVQELTFQQSLEIDGGMTFWEALGGFLVCLAVALICVALL
jgi:hypothetical protein